MSTRRKRRDFRAEIEAHLQLEADRLRAQGLSDEEALAAARRAFGNRTIVEERFYESRRSLFWDHLLRDLRFAFRNLGRERSFAVFAVVLIGLGAGLTTAMFTLFHGVVLRKLAVPDPDSLVHIVSRTQGNQESAIRYSMFQPLQENLDVVESMFGWNGTIVPVTHNGQTQTASIAYITGDFQRTMGARPVLGRVLIPDDDGPVAVISDTYWRRLGNDPNIVGKVIRAGAVALTIVGVLPSDSLELIRFHKSDLLVPLRVGMLIESVSSARVFRYNLEITARLKPHANRDQLQQRLDALWPRLVSETIPPGHSLDEWSPIAGRQPGVSPANRGRRWTDKELPRVTLALLVLAGLATLTMCTNLAGLLLSRGLARHKEYAVRMALGAKRWYVVRYALVEVLLLSCFGGALAILLARWVTEFSSRALAFGSLSVDYGVKLDARVIGFALLLSVATAVAAQIVPALRMSRVNVAESIKAGTQTISARLGGRKAGSWCR
jgi:predicted permease